MRVRGCGGSGDVLDARVHHDTVAGPDTRIIVVSEDASPAVVADHGLRAVRRGGGVGDQIHVLRAATHSVTVHDRHLPSDGDGVAAARADDGGRQLGRALALVAAVRAESRPGTEPARGPEAARGATALLTGDGIDHLDRLTTIPNDEVMAREDGVETAAQRAEDHARPGDDGEREVGGTVAGDDAMAIKHESSGVMDGGVRRGS